MVFLLCFVLVCLPDCLATLLIYFSLFAMHMDGLAVMKLSWLGIQPTVVPNSLGLLLLIVCIISQTVTLHSDGGHIGLEHIGAVYNLY